MTEADPRPGNFIRSAVAAVIWWTATQRSVFVALRFGSGMHAFNQVFDHLILLA